MMFKKYCTIPVFCFIFAFLALLCACTNSEGYLYDETTKSEFSVSAKMVTTFDSTKYDSAKTTIKSDTILVGDSLIFIANITPSNSVKINNVYWKMDEIILGSDFSMQEEINKPGYHDIVFVLIDCFNDTLSDTLHLWVTKAPIIDTNSFIPQNETYGISPTEPVQFAWNATKTDSSTSLTYRFILKSLIDEQNNLPNIVDTFIDKPYFNYTEPLKPLTPYQWEVQAKSNFGILSKEVIKGTFNTKGANEEAGFYGQLESSSDSALTLEILATNSDGQVFSTIFEEKNSSEIFILKPLAPGSYKIWARDSSNNEFSSEVINVTLKSNELQNIGKLKISDNEPPKISSLTGEDTLNFNDSLLFKITDGGMENIAKSAKVFLGNTPIETFSINNKTLTVYLDKFNLSWVHQVLTIIAYDNSNNKSEKEFIIRPSLLWFDANNDTTISIQDSLIVFVSDNNPNSFKTDIFVFNLYNDLRSTMYIKTEESKNFQFMVYGNSFHQKEQDVKTTVIYNNGIQQTKNWKITLNQPPSMDYESNCLYPCDIRANTTAEFAWLPATDEENDSLVYRVIYTRDSIITDSSKIIYGSNFSPHTSATLRNLPVGDIYWWVEAKDSYGGTSQRWEPMSKTTIYESDLGEIDK